jgi:hypothetical protein
MDAINRLESQARLEHAHQVLGDFLRTDQWYPQPLDGLRGFRSNYNGQSGYYRITAYIAEPSEILLCYAYAGFYVPAERRAAAAEFLTRANYNLVLGNFELDYRDGEVRCKASLAFADEALTEGLISQVIYVPPRHMDTYIAGLLAVVYGQADPAAEIVRIEGGEA